MDFVVVGRDDSDSLQHYGILGMKWGIRRYQKTDGSLTPAGQKRYSDSNSGNYTDKQRKNNSRNYNKYRKKNEVDPELYSTFTKNNEKLVNEYADLEKKRLELLRDRGPEAIAKRATEKYQEEKSESKDPFDKTEMIGEDIYSHDQWDIDDAEYLLGKSDKEFNQIASKGAAKKRELHDAWKNEVQNYAGDSAKDSFGMFYGVTEKIFRDTAGRDQTSYWDEFYERTGKALDDERSKIKHSDDLLEHHGILGMKWGIRRYQNPDGTLTAEGKERYSNIPADSRIIPKGTAVYRIADSVSDPTYGRRKYVSLTKDDHQKWKNEIGDYNISRGIRQYDIRYKTVEDIAVAPATKLGELFCEELKKDSGFMQRAMDETRAIEKRTGYKTSGFDDALSYSLAMQTDMGKQFIEKLIGQGYGAIEDYHGRNVAKDPIILLDPDNKIRKKAVRYL